MKAQIISYSFFRTKNGAKFVKGDVLYEISSEQLECLLAQYRIMGFRVVFNNDCFISVSKVENETDLFLKGLDKK